jgi:glycosyltransferase involved in cell wall biosynthesis
MKPIPEHPWFRTEEKTIVLAVGQLKEAKDYPTLLRAIALLNTRRRVCLLILGEGDQRDQLESLALSLGIADEVSMPGYVDNPCQYMSRCAVFALSSIWEGFGNVLVEAMACGAQVVSTRCPGGPVEILADGKYGRLVPPKDPASMASAIESALDNPIPREILLKRSNDFSIDTILPQYYDLLFPEERH